MMKPFIKMEDFDFFNLSSIFAISLIIHTIEGLGLIRLVAQMPIFILEAIELTECLSL